MFVTIPVKISDWVSSHKTLAAHYAENPLPYGSEGAAAFDLRAPEDIPLYPGDKHIFNTGLSIAIPVGHVGEIYTRSGNGVKSGIVLANQVGIIDADYRGELMVALKNESAHTFNVKEGNRIAQMKIAPVHRASPDIVDELPPTLRGAGGFGSTGR